MNRVKVRLQDRLKDRVRVVGIARLLVWEVAVRVAIELVPPPVRVRVKG